MWNNSFEIFSLLKKNGLAGSIHDNFLNGHVLVMCAWDSQGKLVNSSLVRDYADVEVVNCDRIDAHHLEQKGGKDRVASACDSVDEHLRWLALHK